MKILLLAPQPFYSERGTPMNVRLMCQVLGDAGHEVDLVVFPTGTTVELPNVRIIRLPNVLGVRTIPVGLSGRKLFYDLLLVLALPLRCARTRYRVIHGVEEGGFLAVLFARLFRTAAIFDMDSSMSEQLAQGKHRLPRLLLSLVRHLEAWALRNSTVVITVCAALSSKARELAPEATIAQIEDIPLTGCECSATDEQQVGRLLHEHHLAGRPFLLYTGNLEKYQGIDLLLAAWGLYQRQDDCAGAYRLVIVGGSPVQVARYQQQCVELQIAESVVFMGARPAREMGVWMREAQGLVSPRIEGENTPLKIYTYMASGRPVLATRLLTHTQVLDDTVAFLAEPQPEPLALALQQLFADHELGRAKAAAAQQLVAAKYSYPVFRDKLLAAYSLV